MTGLDLATVRPVARKLAAADQPRPFDQGIVVAIVDSTVTLAQVAGSSTVTPLVPYIASYYPVIGDTVVVAYFGASPFVLGGLTVHDTWGSQDWAAAWGEVDYAEMTASHNGIGTTVTDINTLSLSWTCVPNRKYRTTLYLPFLTQHTSTAFVIPLITDTANNIKGQVNPVLSIGASDNLPAIVSERWVSGTTAQTLTRKGRISTGSNTVDVGWASTSHGYIMVEDLGPNGLPV